MLKQKNEIKELLVQKASMIEAKGFVNQWEGNISILDREENLLYITPSGTRKLTLKSEDIAVLNFETEEQIAGLPRSSEYRLHKACMLARPEINSVVHSHTPFLTAYAYARKDIEIDCSATFMEVKKVPCLPYGEAGTPAIFAGIDKVLENYDLLNLGNHGTVAVGVDTDAAFGCMEAIENVLKACYIANSIGGTASIPN